MRSYFNEIQFPKTNAILRAILFWVVFIFLLFLSGSQTRALVAPQWSNLGYGIAGTISAILAVWLFLKFEKRSFRDIGLVWERKTLYRFFKGIVVGTLIFIAIILLLLAFTELRWARNSRGLNTGQIVGYLAFIPLALMEEIAFRSYSFLKLHKAIGLRSTQVIVAIVFALYHILGGWDVPVAFLGPGVWAFVFGLAAVWSGGIAVPMGIHVALNVMQSLVGMKDDFGSVWILKYKEGTTQAAMERTDIAGIIVQLLVLGCAIAATEFYIRKRKQVGR